MKNFTRRQVLRIGALFPATGMLIQAPHLLAAPRINIPGGAIDTHTHFYDPTRPQGVPWPGKDDPALYRPVLPAEFRKIAEPLGITGTIVVEASPWVDDNQWLLDLAEKDPYLLGIVGNLKAGAPDFAKHLTRFAKSPKYRGIRLGHQSIKENVENRDFWRDLALMAEHKLTLDLNGGPDLLADVPRVARDVPGLTIVINHLANQPQTGGALPMAYCDKLKRCGEFENVFLKVSALVEAAANGTKKEASTDPEFYRPALDAAWESFGISRLIFGSNWPVSARYGSLETVVAIVLPYFAEKGPEAAARFFRRNALKAYGIQG